MLVDKSHAPRKRFGQNFLHDAHIIAKIGKSINPKDTDHMVEIGPGQAALTAEVADHVGKMEVIEIDRDLVPRLLERFANHHDFTLHECDALKFDFASLNIDGQPYRLIGNLPYNISSPLIFHILESGANISDMTFMLQKEVVDRMCAPPGSKTYGRLSVMVQYYCSAHRLFIVPPGAFYPPPKVDSAIVRLEPHEERALSNSEEEKAMSELVAAAFSQRRKTIRNTLKKWLSADEIEACGIEPSERAEAISVAGFIRLTQAYLAK